MARFTDWCESWVNERDGNNDLIGSWCRAGDPGNAFCNLCKCIISVKSGGKTRLIEHSETSKHSKKAVSIRNTSKIVLNIVPRNHDELSDKITDAEILFGVLLAEEDMAFLKADNIPSTLSRMFQDSKIASKMKIARQKATYVVNFGVSLYYKEIISEQLSNHSPYSLLVDEGSFGDRKWLAVLCRHLVDGKVITDFLFLKCVSKVRASDLKEHLLSGLNERSIKIHDCLAVMCDSANVMRGHIGGLVSLLQREIAPSIQDIGGCVLHHVHNACSRAMAAIGEDLEELLDDTYNYLRHSKAASEFTKIQEILMLEPLKYIRRVETRWLQIHAVVERHIQLYTPLLEFVRNLSDTEKSKPKVKRISEKMVAPDTLAYLGFIRCALTPFCRFEKFFQISTPIIHLLYSSMSDLFADVLRSFVRPSQIDSMENFDDIKDVSFDQQLSNDNLIIGDVARKALRNDAITAVMRARFFLKVREFYSSLLRALHHYLPIKHRLLRSLQMLDPQKADSIPEKDVVYLAKKLGFDGDFDCLKLEWRHFVSERCKILDDSSVEKFWNNEEMANRYPSLVSVARRGLLIPHGNADTERLFSSLSKILTKNRNRLRDPSLNGLLTVKAFHLARGISASTMTIDDSLRDHVRSAWVKYEQYLKRDETSKEQEKENVLMKLRREEEMARKEAEDRECQKRREEREEKRRLAFQHMEMAKKLMADLKESSENSCRSQKKKKKNA